MVGHRVSPLSLARYPASECHPWDTTAAHFRSCQTRVRRVFAGIGRGAACSMPTPSPHACRHIGPAGQRIAGGKPKMRRSAFRPCAKNQRNCDARICRARNEKCRRRWFRFFPATAKHVGLQCGIAGHWKRQNDTRAATARQTVFDLIFYKRRHPTTAPFGSAAPRSNERRSLGSRFRYQTG